jgi:hypothetical protein
MASTLHHESILTPNGYATAPGRPSRRPWRTGYHGDRRPSDPLRYHLKRKAQGAIGDYNSRSEATRRRWEAVEGAGHVRRLGHRSWARETVVRRFRWEKD